MMEWGEGSLKNHMKKKNEKQRIRRMILIAIIGHRSSVGGDKK